MGIKNSRLLKRNRECRTGSILMVGLDGAGKTMIANKLMNKEVIAITPTVGYTRTLDAYRCKKYTFSIFDVGGQERGRNLWYEILKSIDGSLKGLIFVVDSSDVERIPEAREFLRKILLAFQYVQDPMVPVLVIANKQDVPWALPKDRIAERLKITNFRLYTPSGCCVLGASARNGESLHAAMCKLCDMIRAYEKWLAERSEGSKRQWMVQAIMRPQALLNETVENLICKVFEYNDF